MPRIAKPLNSCDKVQYERVLAKYRNGTLYNATSKQRKKVTSLRQAKAIGYYYAYLNCKHMPPKSIKLTREQRRELLRRKYAKKK